MTNKNILKQWFSNGKRPNQNQFWEWIESYWHKEEKIPQSSIEGLSQLLSDKADGKQMQIHLTDEDAHDLKDKLAKKVDKSVYQEHLSDENAHGLKDKLRLKADLSFVNAEILRLENELMQQQDVVLTSSMGVKYKLTVDEKGALITTKVE